jgi:SAM-dependent methyltransferase
MRSKQLILEKYPTDKHDFKVLNQFMEQYDPVLEPWVHENIKLLELGIHKGGSLLLWRDYFPKGTIVGIDINVPKDFPQEERISLFEGSQTDTGFLSEVATKMAPGGFDIVIDDASHIGEFTKQSFWHLFDNHLKPGGLFVIEDWGTGYMSTWPDGKSVKLKHGYLSKPRSGLHQRINFLINIHFVMVCKFISVLSARAFRFGKGIKNQYFGLLPPFLKMPFESHSYGMVGFVKQLIDEQGAGDLTRGKPSPKSKFSKMIIMENMVCVYKAIKQP